MSSWRHVISLLSAASAHRALSRNLTGEACRCTGCPGSFSPCHPVRGSRHYLDEAVARLRRASPVDRRVRVLICSAAAVILALKRLQLSVAYAIWSGVRTALTALIGTADFREPLTLIKLGSIALVIIGVARLSLASKSPD
ncbi:MAG: SMR family transporter [Methyloceanibacter sp.]